MTDFILFIRNLVLAAILAWLGMEFAPKTPESQPDEKLDASLTLTLRL